MSKIKAKPAQLSKQLIVNDFYALPRRLSVCIQSGEPPKL